MITSEGIARITSLLSLRVFLATQGIDPEPIIDQAQKIAGDDWDKFEQTLIDLIEPHRIEVWSKSGKSDPNSHRPTHIWRIKE